MNTQNTLIIEPHFHEINYPYRYSLGLAYISTQISKYGCIEIIDFHVNRKINSYDEFREEEKKFFKRIINKSKDFDIIAITSSLGTYPRAIKIARLVNNKRVIIGGPHISLLLRTNKWKDSVFQDSNYSIDVAFNGEADYSINELYKFFTNKADIRLSEISGISYYSNNTIKHNQYKPIKNLNFIEFPKWDLFPAKINIGFITTSRGCPHNCTFCDERLLFPTYRFRSVQNIISEIIYNRDNYHIQRYRFSDSSLTSNPNLPELCKEIISQDLSISWLCYASINDLFRNMKLIPLMKSAGCKALYLGFESGNNNILKKIRKEITTEMAYKVVSMAREYDLKLKGSFILGLPGESELTIQDTIIFAKKLDLDVINWHILAPGIRYLNTTAEDWNIDWKYADLDIPNRFFSEHALRNELIRKNIWIERHTGAKEKSVPNNLPLHLSGLTYKTLYKWLHKAIISTKQNTELEPFLILNY